MDNNRVLLETFDAALDVEARVSEGPEAGRARIPRSSVCSTPSKLRVLGEILAGQVTRTLDGHTPRRAIGREVPRVYISSGSRSDLSLDGLLSAKHVPKDERAHR
ncbi:hypothetical protein Val02_40240 [Virgisporangium aliadipatigenens]|uniref:Uncharacterized protein n=1 Tax=Virgisporangium aliadipatigenens TaxID=741659 RepID=A0A8J3YNZ5_9ACTN|nr:hypothetical protein Val02_40240 [Virgisporangium aliadipatigenens]